MPLFAQKAINKDENLEHMPDANFLEYLAQSIAVDNEQNLIEPMELNELDQLGLLTSLNKNIETKKEIKTMNNLLLQSSLKPKEDKQ